MQLLVVEKSLARCCCSRLLSVSFSDREVHLIVVLEPGWHSLVGRRVLPALGRLVLERARDCAVVALAEEAAAEFVFQSFDDARTCVVCLILLLAFLPDALLVLGDEVASRGALRRVSCRGLLLCCCRPESMSGLLLDRQLVGGFLSRKLEFGH